ncbi:hypothetical protein [Magnetococcus sp. PR-3]|uniref:hypothetical protein n=1 Tax=Magnetococcus sp. PR-3 TaxID=3120355 RepID=UPI002FCE5740
MNTPANDDTREEPSVHSFVKGKLAALLTESLQPNGQTRQDLGLVCGIAIGTAPTNPDVQRAVQRLIAPPQT